MEHCSVCGTELIFAGCDDEIDDCYWFCPNESRADHLSKHTIPAVESEPDDYEPIDYDDRSSDDW